MSRTFKLKIEPILLLTLVVIPIISSSMSVSLNHKNSFSKKDFNPNTSYANDYIPSTDVNNPYYILKEDIHAVDDNSFSANPGDTFYHKAYLSSNTPYIFYIAGGPLHDQFYLDVYIEDYPSTGLTHTFDAYYYFDYYQSNFLYFIEIDSSSFVHFDISYEGSSTFTNSFYGIGIYSLYSEFSYSHVVNEADFDFKALGPGGYIFTAGQYHFSGDYYEKATSSYAESLYYISYTSELQAMELDGTHNSFLSSETVYLSGNYIFFDLNGYDIGFQYDTSINPYTPSFPNFPAISSGPFFVVFGFLGVVMVMILAKRRIQKHEFE